MSGFVRISQTQLLALEAINRGATFVDAARAAGIDPRTIHRWVHQDPQFIACLNQKRQELLDSIQSRLIALSETASINVEQAVNAGNLRASISVLRSLRVLAPMNIGSDDPQTLKRELELQRLHAAEMLDLRESVHGVTTIRRSLLPDDPDEPA